jgi:hypothetical protein
MATNNRGGNRSGNRGGRNNNPEGRNQYSGVIGSARSNPLAAAAAVFLWSRRNSISEQIGGLADQVSEWREGVGSDELAAGEGGRTQAEIAQEALTLKETGETA